LDYERKPSDQKTFSLLEDVFVAFPKIPMSIEVKDRGNEDAAKLTIELIKKYNRYDITVVGSDESWWTRRMLRVDSNLAAVAGKNDILKLIFTYWLGLLPYVHFEREAFLLPYMTRDFIKMKENERA
jgi:hypothetical protein